MYKPQSKNLMVLYILNILKEYSDEEHRLSQEEIRDLLEKEYDMNVDRKSIKRNLENLRAEGYEINSTTLVRGSGKKQNEINTDYYIESDFDDSELRFLIDGLIFSKYVPSTQCEDLVNKLKGLTSRYFNPRIEFIQSLKDDRKMNKEIFYTIGVLDEAIREKKKVKFNYCAYDIDKKLKPKKDKETGKNKEHIVNPYYIIAAQGRYYLLCKYDKYEDSANLRIDRIQNIAILDEPINQKAVKPDLPKHMLEHLYMMSGESGLVSFDFKKEILNDVIDWFGTDIILQEKKNGIVNAHVTVNYESMKFWAMQYGENVTVLSPKSLVDKIKKSIKEISKNYK